MANQRPTVSFERVVLGVTLCLVTAGTLVSICVGSKTIERLDNENRP